MAQPEGIQSANDGTRIDENAILQNRGGKEELQREILGCIADELITQMGIPPEKKMEVANAVSAVWFERYAPSFKEFCCNGNSDFIRRDFYIKIRYLPPRERVDAVFIELGFVDGMQYFLEKENRMLRAALQKAKIIEGIHGAVHENIH